MAIKSNSVFWGGFWHILKRLLEISASELSTVSVFFFDFCFTNKYQNHIKIFMVLTRTDINLQLFNVIFFTFSSINQEVFVGKKHARSL